MANKKIYFFIILGTIIFRLTLIFLPGHQYDLTFHQRWSESILKNGLFFIYQTASPNLPPLWIYLLGLISFFYQLFFHSVISQWALKIPAVFADLLTAYLIFYFLKRKVSLNKAFLIGMIYFLHPFVFYNSSIWGQWDSIFVLPLLLAIIFLEKNKPVFSVVFLTMAFLIKLQAVIFFPLFFFYIFKKYKIKKTILLLLISLFTLFLICLPFLIYGTSFSLLFKKTWVASSKMMPGLSLNAFNFWWFIQILIGLGKEVIENSYLFIDSINYKMVGLILFALSYLFIIFWFNKKRRENFNNFILANSFIAFSFYFLPTQMHERYIFPFFALFCLILPYMSKLKKIFIILSLNAFLNLVYVLPFTFLNENWQNTIKIILGSLSFLISLVNLSIFIYLLFYFLYEKNNYHFTYL